MKRIRVLKYKLDLAWLAPLMIMGIGLALQWQFHELLAETSFFVQFPAIACAAWIGKRIANILAASLGFIGGLAIWFFSAQSSLIFLEGLAYLITACYVVAMSGSKAESAPGPHLIEPAKPVALDVAQALQLMKSNLIGIMSWKLSGEIIDANDAFLQMLGYSRQDLRDGLVNWKNLTPSEWDEADQQAVKELLEGRRPRPHEKEYFHKDGHKVPILVGVAFFENSRDAGISFILDVTEQKLIRQELAASEARFRQIAESMPQLVWTAQPDGTVDYYNGRSERYEGFRLLVDRWEWDQPVHPDDLAKTVEAWQKAVSEQTEYQCEHRIKMRDGSYRWHLSRGTPLKNDQGKLERWFGTATDIHDQKQTQIELSIAKEAAEVANKMKSTFLANMSHEIRTPLGAILGFTELLKEPGIDEIEKASFLDVIVRNGTQLTSIIDDILDLSKIEAGQLQLENLIESPRELVGDVLSLLAISAKEKNITLNGTFEENLPDNVSTDVTRLRQILVNIIGNGIKFTIKGEVSCHTSYVDSKGKQFLRFVVRDTGVGLSADQKSRLFQPFSQADESTTRKFGGTGLGLSLSKKLAQALGGDVDILWTEPGVGSEFCILIEDKLPGSEKAVELEPDKFFVRQVEKDLQGIKVLLAEDFPDIQKLIVRILSRKQASVVVASNGAEAMERVSAENFDVILMDVQMPVLDGQTATQLLREQGCQLPIIALTAHAMGDARKRSIEQGFSDFLAKPINAGELVEKIDLFGRRLKAR